MREGNQVINGSSLMPTGVATSRVEGLPRPWNPRAVIAFMKLDAAEVSRFKDCDADFIADAPTDVLALLAEVERLTKIATEAQTQLSRVMRDTDIARAQERAEVERLRAEAARLWEYLHCDDAKNPDGGKRNPYIQEG